MRKSNRRPYREGSCGRKHHFASIVAGGRLGGGTTRDGTELAEIARDPSRRFRAEFAAVGSKVGSKYKALVASTADAY